MGLRQGQRPGLIVSYCAREVPCTVPGCVPVQCEPTLTVVGSGLERDRGTEGRWDLPRVKLPVSAASYLRSTRGLRQIKLKLCRK